MADASQQTKRQHQVGFDHASVARISSCLSVLHVHTFMDVALCCSQRSRTRLRIYSYILHRIENLNVTPSSKTVPVSYKQIVCPLYKNKNTNKRNYRPDVEAKWTKVGEEAKTKITAN